MKLFAAALAVTCFVGGQVRAEMPPGFTQEEFDADKSCDRATGKCEIDIDQLARLANANNVLYQMVEHLKAENAKIREIKGCAIVKPVPKAPSKDRPA
jgi:hypothetical protein